jgi:hypothetical protein
MEGAFSDMSCTVVIQQSSNVKLFSAQRRRETAKLLQFLELFKAMFDCGGNTKAAISGCEALRRKFIGPKKGRFPEIDDAVFTFKRDTRLDCL